MTKTLQIGIQEKFLDALTDTGDNSSSVFTLPSNFASLGRPLVWQSVVAGSPSAINLQLLGALNDVSAEYALLDESTNASGEMRHIQPINVRCLKVRQVSRTGGTSVTVTVNI